MSTRHELNYATPMRLRRRRFSTSTLAILLTPPVIATFCLAGIPDALATGGFEDEGPLAAAICGFVAAAFAMIGGILALGRSVPLLIWNACIVALALGGCLMAGHHT